MAPGWTDGEGDLEPLPRPRGWERTCSTERCVKSRDARVGRVDMEYRRTEEAPTSFRSVYADNRARSAPPDGELADVSVEEARASMRRVKLAFCSF